MGDLLDGFQGGMTLVYGERSSKVRDPFGHEWLLGSTVENVSTEEMQRRYTELLSAKK